jgi:hypothetical protein
MGLLLFVLCFLWKLSLGFIIARQAPTAKLFKTLTRAHPRVTIPSRIREFRESGLRGPVLQVRATVLLFANAELTGICSAFKAQLHFPGQKLIQRSEPVLREFG